MMACFGSTLNLNSTNMVLVWEFCLLLLRCFCCCCCFAYCNYLLFKMVPYATVLAYRLAGGQIACVHGALALTRLPPHLSECKKRERARDRER